MRRLVRALRDFENSRTNFQIKVSKMNKLNLFQFMNGVNVPIALELAEKRLSEWLDAEAALNHVGSYQIGERTLTYRNLKEVRESIDYWQSKVNSIRRGGSFKISRAIPR